jgi:hypothetical protein
VFFINTGFAQKKNKVRLKVQYVKIMNGESYFDISASAKVNRKNIKVSDIDLTIYNEVNDEEIKIGETTTNMEGESKFILQNLHILKPDSTNTYNIVVSFKGNDAFKKASKSIDFKNADIKAEIFSKDSLNYISATLINTVTNSPIANENLNVQIQRLFKPLQIGEEFNTTDENGTIVVNIEEGIPGIDGILNIEVVLNDSDNFGTVKTIIEAPLGTPIIDQSTFDKRTMWSPRNKTPIFLLIFPNLIIFGIWIIIIYLFINLIKISKT